MAEGFAGDPGHEGGNQPMRHLKGTCSEVHIQAPDMGENSGSTDGNTLTPNIAGWDTTTLADTGGSRGIGGNDNRTKST
jgi:hypothetical protein